MQSTPTHAPTSSNSSAEEGNSSEDPLRCVTPLSSSSLHGDHLSDESEEDIPHMLNPYSGSEGFHDSNEENDDRDDHYDYMETSPSKPITYRADSPQHWQLPLSSGHDIANASPVSSISNFSCNTSASIDSGLPRNSFQKEQYVSFQNNHKLMELPPSPKATTKKSGVSLPKLKPRMDSDFSSSHNLDHHNNVHVIPSSPINSLTRKFSKLRSSSPTNSQESKNSSHKNTINGTRHTRKGSRECKSDCLPPPSPRASPRKGSSSNRNKKIMNHRRSFSLNQIPTSSYTHMNVGGHRRTYHKGSSFDEARSSPLRQNQKSLVTKGGRVTQFTPCQNRLIPPKPPSLHNTHRRTVSFPDHVLQHGCTSNSIGNVSPLTLQSDDPALFSLLETTQSSINGRVYIPNDVDPSIYLPTINTMRSISPIPMSNKDNNESIATIAIENENHSQSIIHPKKLESQLRHYAKKHRRTKSGSGSFSSSENKLASLEEEDVLQPEDLSTALVGDKIDLTTQQTYANLTKEFGRRRRTKHHRVNTSSRGKSVHDDHESFVENGEDNHRQGFHRKSKSNGGRKKEKKAKMNPDQGEGIAISTDGSLEKGNTILGEAFVGQMTTMKKEKDQCIIQ